MTKKLILMPFLILLFILFPASCSRSREDAGTSASQWSVADKPAVAVETVTARSEAFVKGIEASGILEGKREADVIAETSGIIREVHFEIGDYVEMGDLLLTVENSLAKSSLDYSFQEYKTARLEFEAVEKSYKTGGTSLVAYNQSRTKLEGARLRYEQAEDAYENTRITAPFSGYISSRDSTVTPGSYLNSGFAVTHLVDTSSFQVRLYVGEDAVTRIAQGDRALVYINALPDVEIEAEVKAVSPGSGRSGGSFPLVVEWKNRNDKRVKSGMSVRVVLQPENGGDQQVIIPASAIVYRNGLAYIFTIRENAAEAVQITPGRILGNRAAIENGVSPGDTVILSGLNSLAPGDPVMAAPLD